MFKLLIHLLILISVPVVSITGALYIFSPGPVLDYIRANFFMVPGVVIITLAIIFYNLMWIGNKIANVFMYIVSPD